MTYSLAVLLFLGEVLAAIDVLPFSPLALLVSTAVLIAACALSNEAFARAFDAPTNRESALITALILSLIFSPDLSLGGIAVLIWAAVLSMASKYIFAFRRKHFFNPAAFAAVTLSFALGQGASWWIGTLTLLPAAIAVALLVARKLRHFDLVLSFAAAAAVSQVVYTLVTGSELLPLLRGLLVNSPIFFFAGVMLTEPQTTPPTRPSRIFYGALVGLLFPTFVHFGRIYFTPELALLVGNIFSYFASFKNKLSLKLLEKKLLAANTFEFVFSPDRRFAYEPGQYLEWTLDHSPQDSRGMRRYFTIASSPTEEQLRLAVRFSNPGSSFKRSLTSLPSGQYLTAGQLAGDFTLPGDPAKKLVFVAGGIGVTPFRSMIKYLIDRGELRDIVIFYANKTEAEIAYRDILAAARRELNIKTYYLLTEGLPRNNNDDILVGYLTPDLFAALVPDWKERYFYLSGPQAMVDNYRRMLKKMGAKNDKIKTDYFPGL
jgi:ferredoxin-NADP reductase/Na+-translocating ferredoxin:NAD+ oxidoreductase RnfD subunit